MGICVSRGLPGNQQCILKGTTGEFPTLWCSALQRLQKRTCTGQIQQVGHTDYKLHSLLNLYLMLKYGCKLAIYINHQPYANLVKPTQESNAESSLLFHSLT